ncbi:MAG: hypothetical protein JXA73_05055 [Acidobacteria bacterium]|nr:hypothetical protein [Acidobacteriota bacterium]
MPAYPLPTREAHKSIAEAIDVFERNDHATAARLLEASFAAAHTITRMAVARNLTAEAPKDGSSTTFDVKNASPMSFDLLYYASAAERLGLAPRIKYPEMIRAIDFLRESHPTLSEPEALLARFNS